MTHGRHNYLSFCIVLVSPHLRARTENAAAKSAVRSEFCNHSFALAESRTDDFKSFTAHDLQAVCCRTIPVASRMFIHSRRHTVTFAHLPIDGGPIIVPVFMPSRIARAVTNGNACGLINPLSSWHCNSRLSYLTHDPAYTHRHTFIRQRRLGRYLL